MGTLLRWCLHLTRRNACLGSLLWQLVMLTWAVRWHACTQGAQEQIATLVAGAEAAIKKDARAGEAALTKGAQEHEAALARSEQALQQLYTTYQAAVEQEWGRVQAAGKRQAAFLKVLQRAHHVCALHAASLTVCHIHTLTRAAALHTMIDSAVCRSLFFSLHGPCMLTGPDLDFVGPRAGAAGGGGEAQRGSQAEAGRSGAHGRGHHGRG